MGLLMVRRLGGLVATGLVLAGLTACGGDDLDPGQDPGEAGVKAVLTEFSAGLASGDGPRACSFLNSAAQRRIEAKYGAGDCLSAVRAAKAAGSADQLAAVDALAAAKVTVEGETADVTGRAAEAVAALVGAASITLVREEERWMLG